MGPVENGIDPLGYRWGPVGMEGPSDGIYWVLWEYILYRKDPVVDGRSLATMEGSVRTDED